METNITSGLYATSFSTRTRDGETYYWVYGWRLGRKVYRASATDFDGSSKNPLETIGWCDYVSEAAYNLLSPVMKEAFDASDHRVAKDGALIEIPRGEGYFMFGLKSDLVYDPSVCTEGEKRAEETCWDGSAIHKEVCRGNEWVPSGETCPPKPECTEGDKKAGYICKDGKWQTAPAVPEPVVPPVEPTVTPPAAPPEYLTPEEADERIRAGLPCYIKCVLPILDLLPGIPYTTGMWVPPFCEITTEP